MHEANESNESSVANRFAEAMREARTRKGWSQRKLAEELEAATGVKLDPSAMTRVETGQRELKLDEAAALARVLEIPFASVLTGRRELIVHECFLWLAEYGDLCSEAEGLARRIRDAKEEGELSDSRKSGVHHTPQEESEFKESVTGKHFSDGMSGFIELVDALPDFEYSYSVMTDYRDLNIERPRHKPDTEANR